MERKRILVIGGDLRLVYLADAFLKNGFETYIYGIDYNTSILGITPEESLENAMENADVIILPLPVSRDRRNINAQFFKADIPIDEFCKHLKSSHMVFGGMISDGLKTKLSEKAAKCFDYFNDEQLTLKNAQITAEGAISTAIENTHFSLFESRVLILGFGRIAKFLAKYIKGFGSGVTICARNKNALCEAYLSGYDVCHISDIQSILNQADIIFNTIPALVLSKHELECIRKKTLVIDLASKPGGIDLSVAANLGINHIQALSLPGTTAPESAGKAIYKTVIENF